MLIFFARLVRADCQVNYQDRRAPLISVVGAGDVGDSSLFLPELSLCQFMIGGKNLLTLAVANHEQWRQYIFCGGIDDLRGRPPLNYVFSDGCLPC